MGLYKPYEEATKALEGPHFALDTPFIDYAHAEPTQWSYQGPPTSPQFQPEPMLYHPYSPPLPIQQPIPHLPITQSFHPTHHNRPTGLHYPSGPTHRTQPRVQPTSVRSATQVSPSDKEGNSLRVKGWTPSEEFEARGERDGFPQSHRGDSSGDHICAVTATRDEQPQEHGTLDLAMRNPTGQTRHLNYIIVTWSFPYPTATKGTATPWCQRLSPTNATRSTTAS